MTNSAATDTGVGRALISTKLKLSAQAALTCIWAGALPGFVVPIVAWCVFSSPLTFDLVKLNVVAAISSENVPLKWRIRDKDGVRKIITAQTADGRQVQYMKPSQVKKVLSMGGSPVAGFWFIVYMAFLSGALGHFIMWRSLSRVGREAQSTKVLRGSTSLVTQQELCRQVLATWGKVPESLYKLFHVKGGSRYDLAEVPVPSDAPMNGMLVQGSQGTGKSLAIHDLMCQVFRKKGRKNIIYDHSGEYYQAYFRPGKDFFFNPACLGSVPWSIFSELTWTYDANTMAHAFLPPKGGVQAGSNAFFEDAARAVFSVLLRRLRERGVVNTRDISRAFLEMPADEMTELIKHSVASSAIGHDSMGQRQGVISSVAIYLDGIASVAPGLWSLREFLAREDDARLFILGTEDTRAMFEALYRLMISIAFDLIAAKGEIIHEDRYWFWLDESLQLGDIALDKRLALLRKFGVCVVTGVQAEAQIVEKLGEARAQTVMNCFNTVLQLQNNENKMSERAAERVGKQEVQIVNANVALAVTDWRDGAGLSTNEKEKLLVLPSEISGLAPCTGYLKFRGFPAAKVDYRKWLPRRPGASAYLDRFQPIQQLPVRDPSFLINVKSIEAGADAFDQVQTEMQTLIATAKEAQKSAVLDGGTVAAVEGDGATPAKGGAGPLWHVIKGELPPAPVVSEAVDRADLHKGVF